MAINPETQYPGRVTPSTPEYPYGAARNTTTTGDGTGTPWEAALVNDIFGFQQALLSAGLVVPSGSPDEVGASQYLEALRKITGKLTDGKKYQFLAAAIRNSGGGWAFINDADHEPVGFTGISTLPDGRIRLDHSVGAVEVGSLLVVPDETYAKQGLVAGCSVGLSSSYLEIGAALEFMINTDTGAVAAPSYWGAKISTSLSAGLCEVTHPTCVAEGVTAVSKVGSAGGHTDILISYSETNTDIRGSGDVDGYIYYDGANWQYLGELLNPPSIVWNSGTNELEVTHEVCDTTNISISPRGGSLLAHPDSISETTFQVHFYNYAGARITTPSTSMKFFFGRKASAPKTIINGVHAVRRGYAKVDANDLVNPSGNFWLIGVQEID